MPPEILVPQASALPLPALPQLGGPAALYLTGEEGLRVTSFGSVTSVALAVRYRLLLPTGRLQAGGDRHVPNSDRTLATSFHPLAEGWLTGVEVFASTGSPRIGQVFVTVELMRGMNGAGTPLQVLWSGYVTDTSRFGWPARPAHTSIDGPGVMRSITGTDPAAGAEVSETVPTNARWRVIAVRAVLVTDATVATRLPHLLLDDGAAIYFQKSSVLGLAASAVSPFHWAEGAPEFTLTTNGVPMAALPRHNQLPGGHRIRTLTTNIQAGDNYAAPQLLVEEWIED